MNGVVRSALAFALLSCTAVACSSAPAASPTPSRAAATSSATAPSPTPSRQAQAVTLADARQALDSFLATDDVVRAAQADRWTLGLTRDGQRAITIAQIHSGGGKPPRYTWRHKSLLVPRQSATKSPQWFAATVERRSSSGEVRTAVLTFVRPDAKSPWQNSFESLLYAGEKPPEVSVDAEGYATTLEPRDQTVAISPNLMGPLHATVAEDGSKGYASGLIAPGPQTTGYLDEIDKSRRKAKNKDCMTYESIFASVPNYPVFALRAGDGGAVILYTLIRTSSWSPALKCGEGRSVPIPSAARWVLNGDDVKIEEKRQIQETQQYVGAVPAKASTAPARVIGYEGAVTKATNR